MLAGGAEAAIIPSGIGGFIACRALSSRNQDPTKASRPWDKNRDGFVMGEGAGVRLYCPAFQCLGPSVHHDPTETSRSWKKKGDMCVMGQGADVSL